MSRRVALPSTDQIHDAVRTLTVQHDRHPSVAAIAAHLGLTNTTFWRHFPDHAALIAERRRRPAGDHLAPQANCRDEVAALRRANQELTAQLATAIAQIQRLTLDNHRLRRDLEAASNVIRIPQHRGS